MSGKSCPDTTNDITIVHEAAASTTADINTTGNGYIDSLTLTGKVRVDASVVGKGATIASPGNVASIAGALTIDPTKTETYTLS